MSIFFPISSYAYPARKCEFAVPLFDLLRFTILYSNYQDKILLWRQTDAKSILWTRFRNIFMDASRPFQTLFEAQLLTVGRRTVTPVRDAVLMSRLLRIYAGWLVLYCPSYLACSCVSPVCRFWDFSSTWLDILLRIQWLSPVLRTASEWSELARLCAGGSRVVCYLWVMPLDHWLPWVAGLLSCVRQARPGAGLDRGCRDRWHWADGGPGSGSII